jgi:hypothetical protein
MDQTCSVEEKTIAMVGEMEVFQLDSLAATYYQIKGELIPNLKQFTSLT